jgi:hypothetical protein
MWMSDDITAKLMIMVNELSEVAHKTQRDVAVIAAKEEERNRSLEKDMVQLKIIQEKQQQSIDDLKSGKDKVSGVFVLIILAPSIIAAICAIYTVMKR